jgi:hypothetical protein
MVMLATVHTAPVSGILTAIDPRTVTIRRGTRTITLGYASKRRLGYARVGDSVRVTVRPNRAGVWLVAAVRVLAKAGTPQVTITAGPAGTLDSGAATFAFSLGGRVIWLSCSLDGSAWFGCASPVTLPTVGPGAHRFAVLAMNGRHQTVVTRDWTVSQAAPPPPPAQAPVSTGAPTIAGIARSKKVVTASPGTWSNTPSAFTYQWLRCTSTLQASCTAIGGATGASYTGQTADIDLYLRVEVTAINAAGKATAVSAATAKTLPS